MMGRKLTDLTGKRFGRLTVLKYLGNPYARWLCVCDHPDHPCGTIIIAYGHHLRNGRTVSCGCKKTEDILAVVKYNQEPHIVNGITYLSLAEVARAYGVNLNTLYSRMRRKNLTAQEALS